METLTDNEYASVDDSTYKWEKTTTVLQLFFQYLFGNTAPYNEQHDVAVTYVATNNSRFLYSEWKFGIKIYLKNLLNWK